MLSSLQQLITIVDGGYTQADACNWGGPLCNPPTKHVDPENGHEKPDATCPSQELWVVFITMVIICNHKPRLYQISTVI